MVSSVGEIPGPVAEREAALADMLAGRSPEATAEEAQVGLEAARRARAEDAVSAPRILGFGVIKAHTPFDGQRFLVAVTNGERAAAITITLTNTLVAELGITGEHTSSYVIERIGTAAECSFKADDRYEEVLLAHPYTFSA
jgi:hypothetical protein